MRLALGGALIVAAAILLVFFRDTEFFWFRGQPLGIVLGIIGALDVAEALWSDRRREPRSGG